MAEQEVKIEDVFSGATALTDDEISKLRALIGNYPVHNHDGRNTLEVATPKVNSSVKSQRIIFPSDFVAGEALANGDWVRVALANEIGDQDLSGSSDFNIQDASVAGQDMCAFSFTPPVASSTLKITIKYQNISGASGSITFRLHSDNANTPGTVLVGPTNVARGNNVTEELTWDLGAQAVTAGTKYWISMTDTATGNTTNIKYASGSGTAFSTSTDSGSTWGAASGTAYFKVYYTEDATGGKLYKCSAITQAQINKLIGVVSEPVNAGATVNGIISGTKTDYTSLTAGAVYYLSNTRGTISTSAGTVSKIVGRALTQTILLINQ